MSAGWHTRPLTAASPAIVIPSTAAVLALGMGFIAAEVGEAITGAVRIRLALLTALCVAPFVFTAVSNRRRPGSANLLSPVHLVAAAVLALYAARGWWISVQRVAGLDVTYRLAQAYGGNIVPALNLTIFGLLSFYAGYAATLGRALGHWLPRLHDPVPVNGRFRAGLWCLAVGFPAFFLAGLANQGLLSTGRAFSGPLRDLSTLSYLGVVFVAASVPQSLGQARRRALRAFWLSGVALVVLAIIDTEKATILSALLALLATTHFYLRRIRIVELLAGGLLFALIVFPATSAFRRAQAAHPGHPLAALSQVPHSLLTHNASTGAARTQFSLGSYLFDTERTVMDRFVSLDSMILVRAYTPTLYPYENGSTFERLPASFVPRALWPGKPSLSLATWFADRYWGRINAKDNSTQAMTFMGEFYLNFGPLAVVFGMFLVGIGYRTWYVWLASRWSPLTVGLYVISLQSLLTIEGDTVFIFRTALNYEVVALGFVLLLGRLMRRPGDTRSVAVS